jgi:uncharacterized protein YjbJ (UPF0337 family)
LASQFGELRAGRMDERAEILSRCQEHRLRRCRYRDTKSLIPEDIMNKDQVKGVAEKMKGKVNEAAGKVTGNVAREMKGDIQQDMGQARKNMGDAREEAKDAAKAHAKRHH